MLSLRHPSLLLSLCPFPTFFFVARRTVELYFDYSVPLQVDQNYTGDMNSSMQFLDACSTMRLAIAPNLGMQPGPPANHGKFHSSSFLRANLSVSICSISRMHLLSQCYIEHCLPCRLIGNAEPGAHQTLRGVHQSQAGCNCKNVSPSFFFSAHICAYIHISTNNFAA